MTREEILQNIIDGYRNTVRHRYQFQKIKAQYEIPETINEETVDILRNYFLNYIYPDFESREALEEAFHSLDDFIRQPQRLLVILLDASKLIFKYGRHLHKILNTGLKALKSFRIASKFENTLVEEVIKNEVDAPYDLPKINKLVKLLPREEIEDLITTTQSLFETLHDKSQVNKIFEIIEHLILIMRSKEKSYSLSQIKGLEFALEGLQEGNKLFNRLTEEEQKILISLIAQIERDWLNLN